MGLTITTIDAGKTYSINGIITGRNSFLKKVSDNTVSVCDAKTGRCDNYTTQSSFSDFIVDGVAATDANDMVTKGNDVVKTTAGSAGIDLESLSPRGVYSTNVLKKDYTGDCVRVRRSTDNNTSIIGFVDGKIDEGTLVSFVGKKFNLVTRSQEADRWSNFNCVEFIDVEAAPDLTLTADKIAANTSNSLHRMDVSEQLADYTEGTSSIFSIHAKPAGYNFLIISLGFGVFNTVWFDLQNGTVGTTSGTDPAFYAIEDAGNGWYKCSITKNLNFSSTNFYVGPAPSDNVEVFAGNNVDGVFLWGAQIRPADSEDIYVPTAGAAILPFGFVVDFYNQQTGSVANNNSLFQQPIIINAGNLLKTTEETVDILLDSNDSLIDTTSGCIIDSSLSDIRLNTIIFI